MTPFTYIRLFFAIQILVACGSNGTGTKKVSEDGSFEVKINVSAGDNYYEIIEQDTFSFTPYPYNFGTIKTDASVQLSCLVLSNRLSRNSRIKVIPIGLLNYQEFDQEKKLIITIPKEKNERVIMATDILDLVTKYPSLKSMIQEWTLGKCGLGCSRFESWEDGNAAGLWIQRNLS